MLINKIQTNKIKSSGLVTNAKNALATNSWYFPQQKHRAAAATYSKLV